MPPFGDDLTHEAGSALLSATGLDHVRRFADLGGTALSLAVAAWDRFHCDLLLVDVGANGAFPRSQSAWIGPYVAALVAHGVPAERTSVIQSADQILPADIIANLAGFGARHRIGPLNDLLPRLLQSGSVMLTDIRKGSGSYPALATFGVCETLQQDDDHGHPTTRVLFRADVAKLPATLRNDTDWADIAGALAGPDGFYRANSKHSVLFIPRGDTLVVTFDNLDIAMTKREDRRPWGFSFIEKQGWSMLGVMANGWTWYRDPWLFDQFDDLVASGFFARFARVVFYGASMGGYAACAFSPACPGADVVAISPQSTLDKRLVPWETRYKTAWGADFSGKYGDGARVSSSARQVSILYDPYEPLDAAHVARFAAPNVRPLRTPLLGHRLGSSLHQMGILQPITLGALNGTLSEAEFYRMLRARKTFGRYQRELFKRALKRGRPDLARRLARWVLTRGDNRYIRKAMADL
jgi:hypothetical protein